MIKNYSYTSGSKDKVEDDDYNSGIKISGKKSKFASKKQDKEEFEKQAEEAYKNDEAIKNNAFKLSSQFVTMLRDKTLEENKTPIQKNIEGDISRQIVEIAMALNNDETKAEGIGSAGGIMLLLRSILIQRDVINNLSYKISKLEKSISELSSEDKDVNR